MEIEREAERGGVRERRETKGGQERDRRRERWRKKKRTAPEQLEKSEAASGREANQPASRCGGGKKRSVAGGQQELEHPINIRSNASPTSRIEPMAYAHGGEGRKKKEEKRRTGEESGGRRRSRRHRSSRRNQKRRPAARRTNQLVGAGEERSGVSPAASSSLSTQLAPNPTRRRPPK